MARKLARGSKLVLASHNKGKLREIEALLRRSASRSSPPARWGCRNRRRPRRISPAMPGSRRWRRRRRAGCRRCRTIPASASPRWAAHPASSRRAGRGRRRISPPRWRLVNEKIGDNPDRRAWFIAALCLAWPDGHTETFVGRIDGTVVWPPRGEKGFGYDPMFVPAGATQTFGEMDPRRQTRRQPSRPRVRPGAGILLRMM